MSPMAMKLSRERGFGAFMMIVFVLVLGASSVGLMFYNPRAANAVDEKKVAEAIATAKEALLAYAGRRGGVTGLARPGELPCPDMNNDGLEETTCGAGAIGRLPWKTLGIPQPTDTAGETLWYAVAGAFRAQPSNTGRINSNTFGNLVVRDADQVTQLATDVVAILFAPGAALGGQNRAASPAASCATTGTSIAPNLCAANYLESSNSTTNGPFNATRGNGYWAYCRDSNAYFPAVQTCTSPWEHAAFNDRIAYIRTGEVIPVMEMRVGNELKSLLAAYRRESNCNCYPWADSWSYSGGIADVGLNRGRFPSVAYPQNWGQGSIPPLPAWVTANDWQNLAYYAAGRQQTAGGGAACYFCSPASTITVDAQPVSALVFLPGMPPPGVNRAASGNRNNLAYYLDDAANQDGDDVTCPGASTENANRILNGTPPTVPLFCDAYAKPSSTSHNRDRLFTLTTPVGPL